jgi:hypothetical protein
MFHGFRLGVLALVLVVCASVSLSHAQQPQLTTVKGFLDGCGVTNTSVRLSINPCVFYVVGVLDATIVTEARLGIPHRYCTRGASYGEVGDAYLSFIFAEQAKGNSAIFSQINTVVFVKFMDARYLC